MIMNLKAIAEKHEFELCNINDNYNLSFDIRNLPLQKVILSRSNEKFSITVRVEFLWGTSEKPSFFSGNNPDKYIFRINYQSRQSKIPSFRIIESSVWNK